MRLIPPYLFLLPVLPEIQRYVIRDVREGKDKKFETFSHYIIVAIRAVFYENIILYLYFISCGVGTFTFYTIHSLLPTSNPTLHFLHCLKWLNGPISPVGNPTALSR